MSEIRHFLGWLLVSLANTIASISHRLCHVGAWCMDIDIDAECSACEATENEPTDGPWAI